MTLAPGTRLGPYQVIGSIGAGGMGAVYRARDTRLDRIVALKVLLPEIAGDPSFALRFEREARIISALNHPRICALHDVGREGDISYLVLEYLEGESLATRLLRGPLALSQVLKYAIEIADALEAAHQRGIIHRDLKPGNIMLTPAGVKLVDFGLAHPAGRGAFAMSIETTHPMPSTAVGTFVGTLQYMAPEQIQGREADARTDIFALGTVIYEMATGKKTFEADTQASLVAKILERDAPQLSTYAPLTPPALNHVVDVCLAKQPSDRWQTAHDVLLHLRWILQEGSRASVAAFSEPRARSRRWVVWAGAAIASIALAAAAVAWGLRSRPAEVTGPLTQIDMAMPAPLALTRYGTPTLSPDGRIVVMSAYAKGIAQLFIRRLDDSTFAALPGTEGARGPFWSPDSRSIAFVAGGKLRRVDIDGGPQTVLADAVADLGGAWNSDGVILFTPRTPGPLFRIAAAGGTPANATTLDTASGERGHAFPHFLPDGKRFLFAAAGPQGGLFAGSLDSTAVTRVVRDAGQSVYLPSGHLLFVQQQTLMAAPFDLKALQTSGTPSVVARQVREGTFSAASNGTLVYRPGGEVMMQLSSVARDGRVVKPIGDPGPYRQIVLSPTGRWVAIQQGNALKVESDEDLWLMDLTTGIHSRLTTEPTFDGDPAWSPDERTLAFTSRRTGRLEVFRRDLVTGVEQPLGTFPEAMVIDDWTPDGRFIVLRTVGGGAVYALPTSGERTLKLLADTPFVEDQSHVSPDGRWIAFNSDETGRWEVYVARFPDFSAKRQISNHGGMQPLWRQDGRELFYFSPEGTVMAVDISPTAETLHPGVPRALFKTKLTPAPGLSQYAVLANGQRFLVAEPLTNDDQTITFMLNWRPPAR